MIISVFILLALIAIQNATAKLSANKCGRQLEKIIYSPGGCILLHMEQIMATLQVQSPLLWTVQNASIIDSFKATNKVNLSVIDAFGLTTQYVYETEEEALMNLDPLAPKAMFSSLQRAEVIGYGFAADEDNYYYTSKFWNRNGQVIFIKIGMLKSDAPFICYDF